jgi:hypothetical protein
VFFLFMPVMSLRAKMEQMYKDAIVKIPDILS